MIKGLKMQTLQADNKHLETVCNQLGLTPLQFNKEVEVQRKRMYSYYGIEDMYMIEKRFYLKENSNK